MLKRSLVIALLLPNARNQTFPRIDLGKPSVHISLTRLLRLTLSQLGKISFSQTFFVRSSRFCFLSQLVRYLSIALIDSFFRFIYSIASSPGNLSFSFVLGVSYDIIYLNWLSVSPVFFELPVKAMYYSTVFISDCVFLAKLIYSSCKVSSNDFLLWEPLLGDGIRSLSSKTCDYLNWRILSASYDMILELPITDELFIVPAKLITGVFVVD